MRPFRLLWAGEGLSLLADQVFIVVLTLLVSRITGTGVERLVQGAEHASGIAGPALAAASVSAFGIGTTFAAEAFVFSVAAVAFARVLQATKKTSFGHQVAD